MAGMCCSDQAKALALLPRVPVVMTAAYEHKRAGILVERVMVCAEEPACVAIAMPKGHRLATLIRDSHTFALNIVDPKQRLLLKKFDGGSDPDAFELLESRTLATGSPCLARATACLDCDVMRHLDLEADYELYVGLVLATWIPGGTRNESAAGTPAAATMSSHGQFTGLLQQRPEAVA
jgi:flavin reductase (DIM6/NTAB) family NADH-FMN oxidoreductase RutF